MNEYFVYIQGLVRGKSIVYKAKSGKEAMIIAIKEGEDEFGKDFVIKSLNKL